MVQLRVGKSSSFPGVLLVCAHEIPPFVTENAGECLRLCSPHLLCFHPGRGYLDCPDYRHERCKELGPYGRYTLQEADSKVTLLLLNPDYNNERMQGLPQRRRLVMSSDNTKKLFYYA
jgi:hypothetical protein